MLMFEGNSIHPSQGLVDSIILGFGRNPETWLVDVEGLKY